MSIVPDPIRARAVDEHGEHLGDTIGRLRVVRVCLYLRKSPKSGLAGHEKEEISLENQEEQLTAWCNDLEKHPGEQWVIVAVRKEKYIRYVLKARRVLMQMLDECREGRYDLILVFNPQRWTGDPRHVDWLAVELEECGVAVKFLYHDPGDSEFAPVISYMEGHASKREQTNIVQRTGDGKRKRLDELGLPLARPAPYGMVWNHEADPSTAPTVKLRYSYLVPDRRRPERIETVLLIFTLIASGEHSGSATALLLTTKGIVPPEAEGWSHATVLYIVRNPAYKGDDALYRTRRRTEGRGAEWRRVKERQDASTWRLKPGVHRGFVAPDLWEEANRMVDGRRTRVPKRTPGEPEPRYLLTGGLAVCDACGSPLNVGGGYRTKRPAADGTPAGFRVRYYGCPSTQAAYREAAAVGKREPCTKPGSVRADVLDRLVWRELLEQRPGGATKPGTQELATRERRLRATEREAGKLRAQLAVAARKEMAYEAAGEREELRALATAKGQVKAALKALEAERMRLLGEARDTESRRERETALVEALTAHRTALLALVPWGDDPGQDAVMRGILRAAGCAVRVGRREPGPAPEERHWGVRFLGLEHPDTDGTTGRICGNRMPPGLERLRRALAALPRPA